MRNILCHNYGECLSIAAADNVETWDCAGCPDEKATADIVTDLDGEARLLCAVFYPKNDEATGGDHTP